MRLSEIINVRRLAMAGALSGAIWCGQAHAQVLDQVPSDALAVFKIKSLDKTNAKVAKLAKAFGLDELSPEMKDPLGSMLEKAQITKGIDKTGDAATAIYAPDKGEQGGDPRAGRAGSRQRLRGFPRQFQKRAMPPPADGLTAVKDPNGDKTLYIGHRGNATRSSAIKPTTSNPRAASN